MVVVNKFVDFVGSDAGFDELADVVEGFGNEFAQLAHFFDFFGVLMMMAILFFLIISVTAT